MANIGCGLQDNKNAKERGYDLYQTTLGETLSTVAADAWKYNPTSSLIRLSELEGNRSTVGDEPLIDRQELNKKYSNLDLFFDQDEKQSTVVILVERKKEERERQSIIQRCPKGFGVSALKLGTSFVASAADPFNLALAFVPLVTTLPVAAS